MTGHSTYILHNKEHGYRYTKDLNKATKLRNPHSNKQDGLQEDGETIVLKRTYKKGQRPPVKRARTALLLEERQESACKYY